ncbi:condensation protein [Nostoc sp. CENA67]|uniref:Condensation protein n=1 Tax=Amazonocrinis nigriterrae CENA67 TaxID=2794033 RepID=A0A8J7HQH9_9NOST|nr:condensation domain-containing protein [Amazonocrinis nigriterrae]MBH8561813.1 condensation protein [Amazonocrinis nigriterrae CENA67]
MSELSQRIAGLSPEKLKLLTQKLNQKKGNLLSKTQIKPQSRESNTFPLSFAQQRLWFLDQLEPGNPAFNICQFMQLTGLLNVVALEKSFQEVVKRHEILRTTFTIIDGQPFQVINPTAVFQLKLLNLQKLSLDEREVEVLRLANEEAQQPFNLAKDCLVRVTLLQLSQTEHALFLSMHHIVSDGWSIGILIQEITTLYKAFSQGYPSPLPELPIQYADFAVWQRQWLQGEEMMTQLEYWKQQLGNRLTVLKMPSDRPRPTVQSYNGDSQFFVLEKAITEKLKTLYQREGITLFMTILAAFKILLHWYTKQEDIVVGTDIANRNQLETKGLIGFFVNQLVLRTNLSDNPSFKDLLKQVRQTTLDAYVHQDLPFDKLVEVLNPKRNLSQTPLFQVKLVLENTQNHTFDFLGLKITPINLIKQAVQFDLLLELTEFEQGLFGLWEYNTDMYETTTITQISANFQLLLKAVATQPEASLNELKKIIDEADKQQRLSQKQACNSAIQRSLKNIKNIKRQVNDIS